MTDDLVKRLHQWGCFGYGHEASKTMHEAADRIEQLSGELTWRLSRIEELEAALLEIFDHECRTSDRSFIACTARDALWPRAALAGEKKE